MWIGTNLVDVNLSFILVDEVAGHAVSPNSCRTTESLSEVAVNRRSRNGLHSFDLTCCGNVEAL